MTLWPLCTVYIFTIFLCSHIDTSTARSDVQEPQTARSFFGWWRHPQFNLTNSSSTEVVPDEPCSSTSLPRFQNKLEWFFLQGFRWVFVGFPPDLLVLSHPPIKFQAGRRWKRSFKRPWMMRQGVDGGHLPMENMPVAGYVGTTFEAEKEEELQDKGQTRWSQISNKSCSW